MMTPEWIESLHLGISPIDDKVVLLVESALEWVLNHTTLDFDLENKEDLQALPATVRLFVLKFYDVNSLHDGIASESIEGLSQSFRGDDKNALIWQLANELLAPYLRSSVGFVAASRRWL